MNFICFVFLKKMMYYTLTLITIFSVISPIFRTCFLQHYYINTLYRHMPYSTVMKLTIIYSCAKGRIRAHFFFFFVIAEVRLGEGSMQGKRDIGSALRCNFLFIFIIFILSFFLFSLTLVFRPYLVNRWLYIFQI